ncbi:hypothetical protein [Massilia aerilata]|uniref:RepB plasmid partition domain-containing protein n=1 Tax=Massilia aerilata TaxID=453817 RepID=A0ABW0S405_9BURK
MDEETVLALHDVTNSNAVMKDILQTINIFNGTSRKDKVQTTWFSLCTSGPAAASFFKGTRDSIFHRLTACDSAASAYVELSEQGEVEVIKPSLVLSVRGQAASLRSVLPALRHLPPPANTQEFCAGLDSLGQWTTLVTAPTNRSGDPAIRTLTLALAEKFAGAFVEIPVEFIHHLVALSRPARSLSATRRVLTSKVTDYINQESEKLRKNEYVAQSTAHLAIQTASANHRRPYALCEADQQTIASLEDQIARIKRGRRRFYSDAARLRAIQDILNSFDDPNLVNDFAQLARIALQEHET